MLNNFKLSNWTKKNPIKFLIFLVFWLVICFKFFSFAFNVDKKDVKPAQYGFEENGVAAVITIGDKNLCNIITLAGEFRSISRGTYSVQGNKIIFNWDNLGPNEAEISNNNGQEILIVNGPEGEAIYKKQ